MSRRLFDSDSIGVLRMSKVEVETKHFRRILFVDKRILAADNTTVLFFKAPSGLKMGISLVNKTL